LLFFVSNSVAMSQGYVASLAKRKKRRSFFNRLYHGESGFRSKKKIRMKKARSFAPKSLPSFLPLIDRPSKAFTASFSGKRALQRRTLKGSVDYWYKKINEKLKELIAFVGSGNRDVLRYRDCFNELFVGNIFEDGLLNNRHKFKQYESDVQSLYFELRKRVMIEGFFAVRGIVSEKKRIFSKVKEFLVATQIKAGGLQVRLQGMSVRDSLGAYKNTRIQEARARLLKIAAKVQVFVKCKRYETLDIARRRLRKAKEMAKEVKGFEKFVKSEQRQEKDRKSQSTVTLKKKKSSRHLHTKRARSAILRGTYFYTH